MGIARHLFLRRGKKSDTERAQILRGHSPPYEAGDNQSDIFFPLLRFFSPRPVSYSEQSFLKG